MGVPNLLKDYSDMLINGCVTAETAAKLTGYNIQHIRRLACAGKLEATHVGRSWLIKITSVEAYLSDAISEDDARFGPRAPARLQTHADASDTDTSNVALQ